MKIETKSYNSIENNDLIDDVTIPYYHEFTDTQLSLELREKYCLFFFIKFQELFRN